MLIDGNNRDADDCAFGDEDTFNDLAECGADGLGKGERIVNLGLRR